MAITIYLLWSSTLSVCAISSKSVTIKPLNTVIQKVILKNPLFKIFIIFSKLNNFIVRPTYFSARTLLKVIHAGPLKSESLAFNEKQNISS